MNNTINKKNYLSIIFLNLLLKEKRVKANIVDNDRLEKDLKSYLQSTLGYKIMRQYERYVDGEESEFNYFKESIRYFQNIIENMKRDSDLLRINDFVREYVDSFNGKIENHKYTSILFEEVRKLLSEDPARVLISNHENSYRIDFASNKEDDMPSLFINDIDNMEEILKKYIDTVENSDSFFRKPLDVMFDKNDAIGEILRWTLINANGMDACDLEYFFSKYQSFFEKNELDFYKGLPKKIGRILNDNLFLMNKKAELAYETPFYLSFMLEKNRVELPNIRVGIENDGLKKVANVFAIQSPQSKPLNPETKKEIELKIKENSPKSKNFRMHNPSHLYSLVLTIGLLNGCGIKDVEVPDFMPLRYRRYVLEGKKSEEELHDFQHHMTDRLMFTFFRMLEFSEGIDIAEYPENGQPFSMHLNEDIHFNNPFLEEAYEVGYNEGLRNRIEEDNTIKIAR